MQAAVRWQALAVAAGLMVSLEAGAKEAAKQAKATKEAATETSSRPAMSAGGFGQAGTLVISSDASADLGFTTNGDYGYFRLQPSADYFLKDNLSLGAGLTLGFAFGDASGLTLGLNFRGGYNIPLTERVSIWPKAGMGFLVIDDANLSQGVLGVQGFNFQVDLFSPVLFHITEHFFVGGGPRVGLSIGKNVDFGFSLQSTLGGHF
jgi:hypothetical protein